MLNKSIKFICYLILLQVSSIQVFGQDSTNKNLITFNDGTKILFNEFNARNYDFPNITIGVGGLIGYRPLSEQDVQLSLSGKVLLNKAFIINWKADIPIIKEFDVQYDFVYLRSNPITNNTPKIYKTIDVGSSLLLYDKEIVKMRSFELKSESHYKSTTHYMTNLEYPLRTIIGLRSGMLRYNSMINSFYMDGPLISEDSITLKYGPSKPINTIEDGEFTLISNFTSTSIFIGIDYWKILNIYYKIDNKKKEFKRVADNFFFDIFITSFIKMEDMNITNNLLQKINHDVLHDGPGGFHYRKTGFRIGYERSFFLSNHSSIVGQLEAGMRPGFDNIDNSYFLLGDKLFGFIRIAYNFSSKL